VFSRVWAYDVPADSVTDFTAAYGSAGDWAKLFARAEGFVRTELYRSTEAPMRFVTVDVWSSEAAWHTFIDRWAAAYAELDARLQPLAAGGTFLVEGADE
jgi:heme-degrading monooxygenase HmoA